MFWRQDLAGFIHGGYGDHDGEHMDLPRVGHSPSNTPFLGVGTSSTEVPLISPRHSRVSAESPWGCRVNSLPNRRATRPELTLGPYSFSRTLTTQRLTNSAPCPSLWSNREAQGSFGTRTPSCCAWTSALAQPVPGAQRSDTGIERKRLLGSAGFLVAQVSWHPRTRTQRFLSGWTLRSARSRRGYRGGIDGKPDGFRTGNTAIQGEHGN